MAEKINFNEIAEEEDKKKIKSEEIICPICKEIVFIAALNYKLFFHGNNCEHRIRNILLKDYEKTQNINILCECKEENKNKNNQEFWICLKCKVNLCPKCEDIHKKQNKNEHIIEEYSLKNYFCSSHYEKYSKYCFIVL